MLKKAGFALLALAFPLTAAAQWSIGTGYANLSSDDDGLDVSLSAVYGSVSYYHKIENTQWTVTPELRFGIGLNDDEVFDVDFEIDRFVALSVKGQYQAADNFYLFVMPSYADVKIEASFRGSSASDSESELGYGVGAGFNITEQSLLEFSFEQYDDTDLLTASIHMKF
ncbi:outer membrane beta-barrel protein [Thalassotalea euphylliae]|uniref:outer membrane beta-barrel protein n=1 Tax=Thalassotalea euphylliae TaxID=1655234 RepID=UPI0015F27E3B|nr:outer membrane beta-barrel protein [Thalassotalea euphylliae]